MNMNTVSLGTEMVFKLLLSNFNEKCVDYDDRKTIGGLLDERKLIGETSEDEID